jgi:ankyrin repeat protein
MQHLLNSVPGIREPGIGYNPLTAAAWGGHIPALQFLLQQGAHPSNQRGTPFSKSPTPCPVRAAAANNRSAKLMQFLLTNGICWCSWEALSRALEDAAAAGNVQVVQLLLDHLPDQVPEARFSSRGALYSAARKKHTAVMRALLEAGLDLPHSSINGALIASAEVGDVQGLALLKQHGADVNCMDREVCPPRTPILQAIRKNHAATVQWLLDNGATTEPSHQHEAIHSLATGALRRLIQHEHNVRMQQNKALFRAARRGFTDVLPMQLDAHLPPAPQEAAAVKARRCIVCSIQ